MVNGHFFEANLLITLQDCGKEARQLQIPVSQVSYSSQRSPWKGFSGAGLAGLCFFFFPSFFTTCCWDVSGSLCSPRLCHPKSTHSALGPCCTHITSLPAWAAPFIISPILPQLELNNLLYLKEKQLLQAPDHVQLSTRACSGFTHHPIHTGTRSIACTGTSTRLLVISE